MKKGLILLWACMPVWAFAQPDTTKGIQFVGDLSWEQVLAKAKSENKYIFVDCYATWCGPCKYMDSSVYPRERVGDLVNSRFVAVRVQMDTGKQDDARVQARYADAHRLQERYRVYQFPTYLFFTPDGSIVHRDLGAKKVNDFIVVVKNAIDPNRQYYSLLAAYRKGRRDPSAMVFIANMARQIQDTSTADEVAGDYIDHYLIRRQPEDLYTTSSIGFIVAFPGLLNSRKSSFQLFRDHAREVDSAMGNKGFARTVVERVITKEEIVPKLGQARQNGVTPNWKAIQRGVEKKYSVGEAELAVMDAKIAWYKAKKDWARVVKYNIEKVERFGADTSGLGAVYLNDMVFNVIFQHSHSRPALEKGLQWMKLVLKKYPDVPQVADTYANLLYKLGRVRDAIRWEERSDTLERESAAKYKRTPMTSFAVTVAKMKRGEKTWEDD